MCNFLTMTATNNIVTIATTKTPVIVKPIIVEIDVFF